MRSMATLGGRAGLVVLLATLTCGVVGWAPPTARAEVGDAQPTNPEQRLAAWREDIAFLASELPRRHKNAFFKVSREEFDQAAANLQQHVPTLSDAEIVLAMIRLVAMIGDGHTELSLRGAPGNLRRLPLSVSWFSDGVFITQATDAHRDILGARLMRIGDMEIEEAIRRVAAHFAAENESALKQRFSMWLTLVEALHAVGVIDGMDRVAITVKLVDGAERIVELEPVTASAPVPMAYLPDTSKTAMPLWLQRRPRTNWFELLADRKALYCRYDRCADEKDQTVRQYADEILKFIDEHPEQVEKVVIDLRRNGGGNSGLIAPLVKGLASRKTVNQTGRLFVLIGRGTFSSALMNAMDFREKTHARLWGEPTSGKPNAYGEVKTFPLPNCKLTVQYSTKFWHRDKSGDPPSLEPDVRIDLSAADFVAGRDPVLEAVLAARE